MSRSQELAQAERLRRYEQALTHILDAAHAGLDQWWAADLQTTIRDIYSTAELTLEGRRAFQVEPKAARKISKKK